MKESCEDIAPKVKPVGFQMSDYVFEINPEQYLYKSSHKKCYFVIHKCRLPGKNKNLFLIGDAFLKHFYSVYDFDRDTVSLGVNMHSKDKVTMYKPGGQPDKKDAPKQSLASTTDQADTIDENFVQTSKTQQWMDLHSSLVDLEWQKISMQNKHSFNYEKYIFKNSDINKYNT